MAKDPINLPLTRSWRDIPQQVKPRAMSREGRRRLWLRGIRLTGALLTLSGAGWAVWLVAQVWENSPRHPPAVREGRPIGNNLAMVTDGVLDRAWLAQALAVPGKASLMDLDLRELCARLLAHGQVATAALIRNFPATLSVHISERTPLVRIMAETGDGSRLALLAARDGVVYQGIGYDPAMLETLPWLDGIRLQPGPGGFAPIAGMETVAELLARAKLEAEWLYDAWQAVSIARLQSDNQIAVRMRNGTTVIFGARDDFFGQLAKLDMILDTVARNRPAPAAVAEIDLSLGQQIPVRLISAGPPEPEAAPAPPPLPPSPLSSQLHIQIPPSREF